MTDPKKLLKSTTRSDALKIALADMREEIQQDIHRTEAELNRAERLFEEHARNRALARTGGLLADLCAATGVLREMVTVSSLPYDFAAEPSRVNVLLTDGTSYDHKFRVLIAVDRPDLHDIRDLRQKLLRLKEMEDPDVDEARANILKDAMEETDAGRRVLEALTELRRECRDAD